MKKTLILHLFIMLCIFPVVLFAGSGKFQVSTITANDAGGLLLTEDGGKVLFLKDGGNVGIGTTNPESLNTRAPVLEIDSSGLSNKLPGLVLSGPSFLITNPAWEIFLNNTSGDYGFNINSGTDNRVHIDVDGYVHFPAVYAHTTGTSANIYMDSSGELWRYSSSRRYKKNIRDIELNTSKVYYLVPKTFERISSGITFHGLIAEAVYDVDPNFATVDNENKPESI